MKRCENIGVIAPDCFKWKGRYCDIYWLCFLWHRYAQPPPHFCTIVESAREWTIQESRLLTPELLVKFWKRESLTIQESRVLTPELSIP